MYISDLTVEKKNELVQELENRNISYEYWEDGELFNTLFIPDTKGIHVSLGGTFDTIDFFENDECVKFIILHKNEYYQIVW